MENFPKFLMPFIGLLIFLASSMLITLLAIPLTSLVGVLTGDYLNSYMHVKTVRNILLGLNLITLVPILTGIALNSYFKKEEKLKKVGFFVINMALILGFFSLGLLL